MKTLLSVAGLWSAMAGVSFGTQAVPIDPARAQSEADGSLLWYDIRDLGVEGQGWTDTKSLYDRLPAKAEGVVREPVWKLSLDSAGMSARFLSNATTIEARWKLRSERLGMPHMPPTGVSGLDLYVKDEAGTWRWLGVGRPTEFPLNRARLVGDMPEGTREYQLYLPLYNGVESVEIGLPPGSKLWKAPPRPAGSEKPIVFYGTSITHGCCASRPGMVHTAILGRRLNRAVVNLGFSGNGKMEPEVARLLAELDPALYVIDCLPNMRAEEVSERVGPLVRTLRRRHPSTPIVLVEDRSYTNSFLLASQRERNQTSRAALKAEYSSLQAQGVPHLYYIEGELLLGGDGEGTVDSSHPTDLGFFRQAQAFYKVLAPILKHPTHLDR